MRAPGTLYNRQTNHSITGVDGVKNGVATLALSLEGLDASRPYLP